MKIIQSKNIGKDFFTTQEFGKMPNVAEIIDAVKKNRDKSVRFYAKKFDGFNQAEFKVTKKEIKDAYKKVDKKTINAIKKAASNIRFFAKKQFSQIKSFETKLKGTTLGQKIIPIERIGCYVPGGRYPLPSTALMCIMPAKVAGAREIIVCSPKIKPETIVAANIAGADAIFNLGGVQAIAAMAYGTKRVPKVDKIVGPGNAYVTEAKKQVYGEVGIDFLAGPSEVLIIADNFANPEFLAADLLAQAEHDPNAQAILITTSARIAKLTQKQVNKQLAILTTREVAEKSIRKGLIIISKSLNEAAELANLKAPEHLELQIKNTWKIIPKLRNYGSLFIGQYSAEVFGDYCTGTNHTLPTNGAARYTGGLSVKDFVKILTYQKITKKSAQNLIPIAQRLAFAEGLDAHKKAAQIREK